VTRLVPGPLQAALDIGATTLARAWALTRNDGMVMGFTDHDRPLAFDGVTYAPESGFESTAIAEATGLSVDTHTVSGALSSAAITEADIARGLYDGAEIAHWLVDWTDPANRLLLGRGRIGEIRHHGAAFEAEIVGLAEAMNQPFGRAYLAICDLRLGEPACGVDLDVPAFRGTGSVTAAPEPQRLTASGIESFEPGWFARGALTWTDGANTGQVAHIRDHRVEGGGAVLELWQAPALPVVPGDAFTVTAGCDKTLETCRVKFDNILNFRGFPHMPGDDWVTNYPNTGEGHDGGSLNRS